VRSLASSGAAGVMVALLVACWLLLDYPWEITPSRYSDSRAASVGPLERWPPPKYAACRLPRLSNPASHPPPTSRLPNAKMLAQVRARANLGEVGRP
jgi:hypothetical protein